MPPFVRFADADADADDRALSKKRRQVSFASFASLLLFLFSSSLSYAISPATKRCIAQFRTESLKTLCCVSFFHSSSFIDGRNTSRILNLPFGNAL
jgi:hypothetical protein